MQVVYDDQGKIQYYHRGIFDLSVGTGFFRGKDRYFFLLFSTAEKLEESPEKSTLLERNKIYTNPEKLLTGKTGKKRDQISFERWRSKISSVVSFSPARKFLKRLSASFLTAFCSLVTLTFLVFFRRPEMTLS